MTRSHHLLPEGWQLVRFGDVVQNVKVDIAPEKSNLERYIAGEHMDTDNLHIRRWGTIGDGYLGPAFHRKFVEGQVLYGSCRTYLRKVAVAKFDGICANTTFVLEPKSDELISELLPFIMQTESFVEHSVKQSKGSVNPYINWKDLAWYEFVLPPKDEQRRIAEILWAADEAIERDLATQEAFAKFQTSLIESFLTKGMPGWHDQYTMTPIGSIPESWSYLSCNELFTEGPRNGLSPKTNAAGLGYPTLSIGAIRDGQVVLDGNVKYAEVSPEDAERFRLRVGDLIVVRGNGNHNLVGKCGIVEELPDKCFYPDLLIRISFDQLKMRSQFVCIQWNAPSVHRRLSTRAKSTNGIWKVNGQDLLQHSLVIPPVQEQDAFLRLLGTHTNLMKQIQEKLEGTQKLKRGILKLLVTSKVSSCHV